MRANSGLRRQSGGQLKVKTDTAVKEEVTMRRRESLITFPMRANQGSSIAAGEPAVAIQTNEE
eukprot:6442930-Prorocentrum_lima.AAC.1